MSERYDPLHWLLCGIPQITAVYAMLLVVRLKASMRRCACLRSDQCSQVFVGACRGCVRNLGLSANQVLHIPGAGDFQIKQMRVLDQPAAHGTSRKESPRDNADSASAMEVAAPQQYILPDTEQQEPLVRENEADDLVGEQTWPTDKVPFLLSAPASMQTSCIKAQG